MQCTSHKTTAYEMFDFAGALAQRLAELVKARKLQPANVLWVYAVDNVLIKAVDSQTQVSRCLVHHACWVNAKPWVMVGLL